MTTIMIIISLALLGAVLGSFAGAQVWRLRAWQLDIDRQAGHAYDRQEWRHLRVLRQSHLHRDRSRCLQCGHVLSWYDLVPLASWLSTKGHCRYCQTPIGLFEPIVELVMGLALPLSYILWPWPLPLSTGMFILWVVIAVVLLILAAYDAKWRLLPDQLNYGLMILGLLFVVMRALLIGDVEIGSLLGSLGMLAGLYGVLYVLSRGAWIGFGDVKLCVGLALLLSDWRFSFMTLFFANILGCLIVLPGLIRGKLHTQSQVPFGPLLIVGCVVSLLLGGPLLSVITKLSIG